MEITHTATQMAPSSSYALCTPSACGTTAGIILHVTPPTFNPSCCSSSFSFVLDKAEKKLKEPADFCQTLQQWEKPQKGRSWRNSWGVSRSSSYCSPCIQGVKMWFFLLKQGGAEHWGSKLTRGFHSKEFFLHTPRKAERVVVYRTLVKVRSSAQWLS